MRSFHIMCALLCVLHVSYADIRFSMEADTAVAEKTPVYLSIWANPHPTQAVNVTITATGPLNITIPKENGTDPVHGFTYTSYVTLYPVNGSFAVYSLYLPISDNKAHSVPDAALQNSTVTLTVDPDPAWDFLIAPGVNQTSLTLTRNVYFINGDKSLISFSNGYAGNASCVPFAYVPHYSIRLHTIPEHDVTLTLVESGDAFTAGGVSRISPVNPTLTFTPANWDTFQSAAYNHIDWDLHADGNKWEGRVNHVATSADPFYNGGTPWEGGLSTICFNTTNLHEAGVALRRPGDSYETVFAINIAEGGSETFYVVLTSQPYAAVTVNLAYSGATPGVTININPSFVVLGPACWNVTCPKAVVLTAIEETVSSHPSAMIHPGNLTMTSTSADPQYVLSESQFTLAEVIDNDVSDKDMSVKWYFSARGDIYYMDTIHDLAMDVNSTGLIATGTFRGPLDLGQVYLVPTGKPSTDAVFATKLSDDGQTVLWATMVSPARSGRGCDPSVSTDSYSNVYLALCIEPVHGSVLITSTDNNNVTVTFGDSTSISQPLLVKWDKNGVLVWHRTFGIDSIDAVADVVAHNDNQNAAVGSVTIAGTFGQCCLNVTGENKMYFDATHYIEPLWQPPPGLHPLDTYSDIYANRADSYIVSYDTNNNWLGHGRIAGYFDDIVNALAVDEDGFVYMAGYFRHNITLTGSSGSPIELISLSEHQTAYLTKFKNGEFLWAVQLHANFEDTGHSASFLELRSCAAHNGFVYCAGQGKARSVMLNYGTPAQFNVTMTNHGHQSPLIMSFNATDGEVKWLEHGVATGGASADHIDVDPVSGHIYVAGEYQLAFYYSNLVEAQYSQSLAIYVALFLNDGTPTWIASAGTKNSHDDVSAMAVDSLGQVTLGGTWTEGMTFGALHQRAARTAVSELYIARLNIGYIMLGPEAISVVEGSTATYTVSVGLEPLQPVTVNIVSPSPRVSAFPTQLVFTRNDFSIPLTVTVTPFDDDIKEANEVFTLTHTTMTTDIGYGKTQAAFETVTVIDPDTPNFVLSDIPPIPYDAGQIVITNFMTINSAINLVGIDVTVDNPTILDNPAAFIQFSGTQPATANLVYTPKEVGVTVVRVKIRYVTGYTTAEESKFLVITDIFPDVAAILPTEGPAAGGTRVTITGVRLNNVASVSIGGQPCNDVVGVSITTLTCTTSPLAATDPPTSSVVLVKTVKGVDPDPPALYTYWPAGTILSFTPILAFAAQPTLITIVGDEMARSQGDLSPPPTVATVPCASYTYLSNSSITCVTGFAPAHNVGKVEVTSLVFGEATSVSDFTFIGPTLSSITPTFGDWRESTLVTVKGVDFGSPSPDNPLTIDTIRNITIGSVSCTSVTQVSDSVATCTAPPSTARGSYQVVVNTALGGPTLSKTVLFEYGWPPPVIDDFSPKVATIRGGIEVDVTGKHFGANASMMTGITIGTVPCATSTYVSDTQARCLVAPVLADYFGTVNITTVTGGNGGSNELFVYGLARPIPESVTPDEGPITGGVTVTIRGKFLGSDPRDVLGVELAGEPCATITWVSDNEIQCVIRPSTGLQPKTGNVTVSTRSGGSQLSAGDTPVPFKYVIPGPRITGVFPRQGLDTGGTAVTVVGGYFGVHPGNLTLTIAGVPCTDIRDVSDTKFTCTSPAAPDGFDLTTEPPFVVERKAPDPSSALPTTTGFKWFPQDQICAEPCGLNADCIFPNCVCRKGFFGAPACETEIISMSPTSLRTCEDSCASDVRIRIAKRPTSDVKIRLASSDLSEADITGTPEVTFTPDNWQTEQTVNVIGLYDLDRDGTTNYHVRTESVSSSDSDYNEIALRDLPGVNADSLPEIREIRPKIIPLNGSIPVTVIGRNFDKFPLISIDLDVLETVNVLDPNITVSTVRFDAELQIRQLLRTQRGTTANEDGTSGNTRRLLSLDLAQTTTTQEVIQRDLPSRTADIVTEIIFTAPRADSLGYRDLSIRNTDGLSAKGTGRLGLYYSDDCPEEGFYGRGGDCRPCPEGAECPGGYRIWPLPGWWNPGEDSGGVWACPQPVERCLGGSESKCAEGYVGRLCSTCAEGYYLVSNICEKCENEATTILILLGDMIVWLLISIAGWNLKSNEDLGHVIAFVIAVQEVGSVGEMVSHLLPRWLLATYNVFYMFSGDVSFLRPNCYGNVPFVESFWIGIGYQLAVGVPVILGVPLVSAFSRHIRHRDKDTFYKEERRKWYRLRFRRAFTIWLLIMYYSFTKSAISGAICGKIAGADGLRLLAQPDQECFTGPHVSVFLASVFIFFAVTIGYPLLYVRSMMRNRSRLYSDPSYFNAWDFLYDPFLRKYNFVFLVELFVFAMIAVGTTVIAGNILWQFILVGGAFLVFIAVIAIFLPMRRQWENFVALAFNIANFLAILLVFLIEEGVLSDVTRDIILYALVTLVAGCIFTLAGVVFYHVVILWDRREQNVNKEGGPSLGASSPYGTTSNSTLYDNDDDGPWQVNYDENEEESSSAFQLGIKAKSGALKKSESMVDLVLDMIKGSTGSEEDDVSSDDGEFLHDNSHTRGRLDSDIRVHVDELREFAAAGDEVAQSMRSPSRGRALSRAALGESGRYLMDDRGRTSSEHYHEEKFVNRERRLSGLPVFHAINESNITPTDDTSQHSSIDQILFGEDIDVPALSRHGSNPVIKRDRKGSNGPLPLLRKPNSAWHIKNPNNRPPSRGPPPN